MWTRLRLRFVALFRRARFEHDLADELAFHVAARAEEWERRGLSPSAARRRALIPDESTQDPCEIGVQGRKPTRNRLTPPRPRGSGLHVAGRVTPKRANQGSPELPQCTEHVGEACGAFGRASCRPSQKARTASSISTPAAMNASSSNDGES